MTYKVDILSVEKEFPMKDLKILIVDDDPVTLKLLEKKLKKADYEVETAKNGIKAVQLIF